MILLHKKLIALSILYPVFAEVLKPPIKLFLFAKSLRIVVSSLSSSDCKSALFSTKIVGRGFPSKNFADLSTATKTILIIDMLAGRLELIPFLVLFQRDLWTFNK